MVINRRLLLPAVLTAWLTAAPAAAQVELFVTNQADEGGVGDDSVLVYEVTPDNRFISKEAPLAGQATALKSPFGVAVARGKLFVANQSGSITVYSRAARGNVGPIAILGPTGDDGAPTGLDVPTGLAVTSNELFVANQSRENRTPSITVYGWGLADGQVTIEHRPRRTIKGPATGLSGPSAVVVDGDELFVANTYSGSVTVYGRMDDGEASPRRQIVTGNNQPLRLPAGLAVDGDELFVTSGYDSFLLDDSVFVFNRDGAPHGTLSGTATRLHRPMGVVVDRAHDRLFVANPFTTNTLGSITVYGRMFRGDTEPLRVEPDARLSSPVGLALAPSFQYLLTGPAVRSGAPGSSVTTQITATLLAGSGTIFFDGVSGLAGAQPRFVPPSCTLARETTTCVTALTIMIPASTPPGSFPITVTATGTPLDCQGCRVDESTSFTLKVTTATGTLQVNTDGGTGRGTVTIRPPGISCSTRCTETFSDGTEVELAAVADPNSDFVGWDGGGCAGINRCLVTVTESTTTTVTAIFDRNVSLTILNNLTGLTDGSGKVEVSPEGRPCDSLKEGCHQFPSGTSVTLIAIPADGSKFAGWEPPDPPTDDPPLCQGVGPCRITLDKDVTVTAYFGSPQEAFIASLYLHVLGIRPDRDNTHMLIAAVTPQPGLVFEALIDAFFHGPRFGMRARTELTPSSYVAVFYRALLGREPDAQSRTLSRCGETSEPAATIIDLFGPAVADIINSPEFRGRVGAGQDVSGPLYRALLNRAPTGAERDRLERSGDFLCVTLEIVSSVDYERRQIFGLLAHIRLLYLGLLGRGPTVDQQEASGNQLLERGSVLEQAFVPSLKKKFDVVFPEP